MEDLFDILIVIAIAVFGIASKSKKKNKKNKAADKPAQATKPAQAAKPVSEPAKPARPLADLTKDLSRENIESAVAAFTKLLDTEADLPNPDKTARKSTSIESEISVKKHLAKIKNLGAPASGESKVDDHGCIGGSMPNHNAEGETFAEHAEHEQNREKRLAEEAALNAASLRKPSAADLRRAVVMSEVLDKPVSLRGRRI